MAQGDQIDGLLADLDTITDVAKAGVISRKETRLEPGEKRFAAILFLDLVGFSELSQKLPPDDLTTLLDRTFRIFELSVKGQGGYCDKVIGDAALYVFPGHPNHPPACEAALRAAVMLLDRARQISDSLKTKGLSLEIRVGISFGEVARQQVGGSLQQTTVVGETVNIAQRLEESALPGTVQTTIRVLERAGELTVSEMRGKLAFKGFGDVEVHQVWRFKPSPVQLRGAFRRLSPLIGRDEVMEQAVDMARDWLSISYAINTLDITSAPRLENGKNRLMIFRGNAAVGKSRMAYELLEAVKKIFPVNSASGHCTVHGGLSVFAAELVQVAGLNAENLPDRWEELCQRAEKKIGANYANRQRSHLPMLAYLLDCSKVDTRSIKQADAGSFMLEVKLTLRACCELIAHTTGNPVILVVEDLQWMGELKDTIADLLRNTALPQPLIILATARPELQENDPLLAEILNITAEALPVARADGMFKVFNLEPLTQKQGRELMQKLLPGLELPPNIEAELHEKAIGLPYYYEEFARLLVRREQVVQKDGEWKLAQEIDDLAVPDDIRMLILGRLDQLEPELRALAGRASVLGRSFLKGLLTKFEQKLGTTTPEELEQALADLNMHHVLSEETGDRYFFEHVLTREAAYGALLRTNRIVLHRMAARVLTDLLVPGTAGEWEILPELIRHLFIIEEYSAAHQRCCDLLLLMAYTGRYDQWNSWENKAIEAWERRNEQVAARTPVSASLMSVQGWQHYCLGRMNEARNCYLEALEIAKRHSDSKNESTTLNFLGTLHRNQGRLAESQDSYEQALEIMEEIGDFLGEGTVLRNLGILHAQQGRMNKAKSCFERSLVLKRGVGDYRGEGITLNNLGKLHQAQSRMGKAHESYELSLLIKRETSDRRGEGITLCNMGMLHSDHGRLDDAHRAFQDSLAIFREIGDRRREGLVLNCMGSLHQNQGQMTQARECYDMSLEIRRELSDRDGEGSTLTNLGTWFSEQGDHAVAEATQLEALAISHRLGMRNLEGEVLAELGKVYMHQGRLDDAFKSLDEAYEILSKLSDNYHMSLSQCYKVRCHLAQEDLVGAKLALENAQALSGPIGAGAESALSIEIASARQAVEDAEDRAKAKG